MAMLRSGWGRRRVRWRGGLTNHVGWLRLPGNASIFGMVGHPSVGPGSSYWEIIFAARVLFFSLGLLFRASTHGIAWRRTCSSILTPSHPPLPATSRLSSRTSSPQPPGVAPPPSSLTKPHPHLAPSNPPPRTPSPRPAFLSTAFEIFALREAVKAVKRTRVGRIRTWTHPRAGGHG
jgi:hypothetical protein